MAGDLESENSHIAFDESDRSLPSCASDVLSKLTPTGEDFPGAPYTGGGLSGAGFGIALDPHGNVWVGNFGFFGTTCPEDQRPLANSVSLFTSDGVPLSPDGGFTNGSIDAPQATVSDQLGNIWIANQCGGSVTQYRAGNPDDHWIFSIDDAFGVSNAEPFGIAIDVDRNGWVTDNRNDRVIELSPDGVLIGFSPDDAGIKAPMGVAIDSLGNVWVANSGIVDPPCAGNAGDDSSDYGDLIPDLDSASVTLLGPDGIPVGEQPFQGGGILIPWGIAVDGNDNIWVCNFAGKRVTQLRGANGATWPPGYETGDPIAPDGYHSDALTRNTGVSIDPSGNVWLTNNWLDDPLPTNPGGDGLVVFIGLAAPVKTPLIGPPQQP